MDNQKTIASNVYIEGTGLHTGKNSKLELLPAQPNTGIIFIRKDIQPSIIIKADFTNLLNPKEYPRRTSIGLNGIHIHTIEHFMSALNILGIDNLQVNIWGEEIPGLDGSSKIFIDKIKEAGISEQNAPRQYLIIKEPIWVEENTSVVVALPYSSFRTSYILKYDNPIIGTQYVDFMLNKGNLSTENIYEARTFCIEDEVRSLLEMGLGKGANYENTLVVSEKGIVNNNLRISDEFVKHKTLDLIGDLYIIGPIKAHIIAIRSGHSLNIKLLEKLYKYKQKIISAGITSATSYIPKENYVTIEEIMRILPHRYPFLLVDRIIQLEKGKRAIGIKNISINEHFFQGHFPNKPIMPGVLIIEAMAQVGGVLMLACEENKNKFAYFMAIDKVKFRKTVEPGDQLIIEVFIEKIRSKTGVVYAKAFVEENLVAEAKMMFALANS